ncbi:MAG: archaeoflavoprotein AfpA [Archaeoglobus sp.]|nr:archaeoflavoprotein AfpA [Archaeoglobus sp.]
MAKKLRVAWGITGAGDKIEEIFETMRKLNENENVEIYVYLSKAGEQVVKFYRLYNKLKESFERIYVEKNANSPFLAGQIQSGKFDFLIIAPSTANTTAKISQGIADTLLTNSALMALKAYVPVYILPTDYKIGDVQTKLPDGRMLTIRIREEDVAHVEKLRKTDGVYIVETPDEILSVFEKHLKA